ncbi:MAG: hypothetical protein IAA89_00265 [Firmicutes bacterium]|uniref:Uncharacterized protein n=1 Tax=Candidatus Gallilactobacillus intestinavium TaxID=2840838 RepID=A0A9D9E6J8_9LACO|nr:hypothetical protein [Candidatus Gallilactobacillus intestinavium]
MDCRGVKRRENIVRNYDVVPVAHVKLLKGQTKKSDAGPEIDDQYYVFKATNKNKSDDVQIIQCGMGAARNFLSLTNRKSLPLFNPLVMPASHVVNNNQPNTRNSFKSIKWDPTAEQLHNAIMWMIIVWNKSPRPNSPLFKIKSDLERYPSYKPYNSKIKAVNTMIQNGDHGSTLTDSINNLKNDNNIRATVCDFGLLTKQLHNSKKSITSWF